MKNRQLGILFILAIFVALAGCKKESDQSGKAAEKDLAAKAGDWTLTRAELDTIVTHLPESQKAKYQTPDGKAALVDQLIRDEIYYREGLKKGIQNEQTIKDALHNYERSLVIKEYYTKNIEVLAAPTDQELHDYYEEHQDKFKTLPVARAQHIFSKSPTLLKEYKKRIDKGEKMTTLAHKYSEDELTRGEGGDLGYFNPGGYIRGAGFSKALSDTIFQMKQGVVYGPVKWEKGYSLVRVNEIRPASLKPFEDVKDEIKDIFVRQRIDRVKAATFAELKKNYDVANYLAEQVKLTQRTPKELWNLAQTSTDSYQRLRYYQEIVDRYPESEFAAQAMFMVGFVQAEELKDYVEADRAFNRVVSEYPNADVAKSAQWMLENLNKPLPQFDSLDDLNKRITDSKKGK